MLHLSISQKDTLFFLFILFLCIYIYIYIRPNIYATSTIINHIVRNYEIQDSVAIIFCTMETEQQERIRTA